jgi:hypothetical protein
MLSLVLLGTMTVPFLSEAPCLADGAGQSAISEHDASIDTLLFGNVASEAAHGLADNGSKVISGGLGEPARVLLPQNPADWYGGNVAFAMKVDPTHANYLTVRLWGSDVTDTRLLLEIEGKQVGWRHLGEIDLLDTGTDQPGYNGRFYYTTTPLPLQVTKGKTEIHCEIIANGRVWGYGTTWDQYQKPMTEMSRGIYSVYTHTGGTFVPPSNEKQGVFPAHAPVRQTPGPEMIDAVKQRINKTLTGLLNRDKVPSQQELHLLARAYLVKWSVAYQNPNALAQVTAGIDHLYIQFCKDPTVAQSEPSMYNPDWFGMGFAGDSVHLLAAPLSSVLDQSIDNGTGVSIKRRDAWSQMLQASRDWHLQHRRQYSNQSMITDLNTYTANRGVEAIDPSHALSEEHMLHYLYQSIGLEPWLGSDLANGQPSRELGNSYYQLTAAGLTKELGFVGYYGEVLDWVTDIYDATRPSPEEKGDPKILAQLNRIAHARNVFRYPSVDADGNRAMRAETIVGWRDEEHYPGDITYAERPTWDASAITEPAATLDPQAVGAAGQMFADNQFFNSIADGMKETNLRTTAGMLGIPDDYALLTAQPPSAKRLPMSDDQPDFVFADPDDGVLAVKHGSERFYASLYWRARNSINFLARVHDILPTYDRIAVVHEDEVFEASGMTYTRPDHTNFGFANGGLTYPDGVHSAEAGEQLPIAKIPDGVAFKPGDESPYAGRAQFYALRYGNFLVGMNTTMDHSYQLNVPNGLSSAVNLKTGTRMQLAGSVTVRPRETVVLYIGH